MTRSSIRAVALALAAALLAPAAAVPAQEPLPRSGVPVRQHPPGAGQADPALPLTLRDAARPDRWLGAEVRDARWSPDGEHLYFRWHHAPRPGQDPQADPWYRADRSGRFVEQVPASELERVPGARVSWSRDGRRAAWGEGGRLFLHDASVRAAPPRPVFTGERSLRDVRILPDGDAIDFLLGDDLYRYRVADGSLRQLTRRHAVRRAREHPGRRWLAEQQRELFEQLREDQRLAEGRAARARRQSPLAPQPIPVEPGVALADVRLSPDGEFLTFRWTRTDPEREGVRYLDYVTASGHAEVRTARPKIGEPRDEHRFGIVRVDPSVDPDSVGVLWVEAPETGGRPAVIHGPYWNLERTRAVVQILTTDHKDLYISALDLESGRTTPISHDRDEAWLGGPPPQPNRLQPALLEWLPGDRFVFASERSGWSHLYLAEPDGTVRALTEGPWEVRDATLSRDRSRWILGASREHPADDHLYSMPAAGGTLVRLTEREGRHTGILSPDGRRLAVVHSDAASLPDLYLRDAAPGAAEARLTASGSENFHAHRWIRPEMVSFPHPDGGLVWGALFRPERPNAERAAVLHIHGGGYRQFAHRGWSVYGYANHVGFIHYLVQQGYTVLDFDYRGSAGFGRDYRTDIHRSMGVKDVDGAVAAVDYLAREHGVDRSRVGLYGVSYGGFFTLMSLFRYPGVFAAGVANDAVSDWAHYSDGWTSPILNLPHEDPEAFRVSSPIHHAAGLRDPLLIAHGVVDDNVHFQDAVRLVQRLIELEKEFDVMYYPVEAHNFRTETSRADYYRRVAAHFERHLLRRGQAEAAGAR